MNKLTGIYLMILFVSIFSIFKLKLIKKKLHKIDVDDFDNEPLTDEIEQQILNGQIFTNLGFDTDSLNDELFNSLNVDDNMESSETEYPTLEFEKCLDNLLELAEVSDEKIRECDDLKVKNCNALTPIQKSLYFDCVELQEQASASGECAHNFSSEGCPGYIPIEKCKHLKDDKAFVKCNNDFCLSVKDKGNLFCINLEKEKKNSEEQVFCSKNNYENWKNEKCGGFVPNECSKEFNKEKCNKFCSDKSSKFEYNEFCKYKQLSEKQPPECKLNTKAKGCIDESPLEYPEFAVKSNTPEDIKAWNNKVIEWCQIDNRSKTSFVCYTMISQAEQLKNTKKNAEILKKIDGKL